jgi:hypothetical protein
MLVHLSRAEDGTTQVRSGAVRPGGQTKQELRKNEALKYFGQLMQIGSPLQSKTEAKFNRHRSHLPPQQGLAFDSADADPIAIIAEVFGPALSGKTNPGRDAALEALIDPEPSLRVQTLSEMLSTNECRILREHCDNCMVESQLGGSRDNVDGLPDFQVNIERRELGTLLHASDDGGAIVDRLCTAGSFVQQNANWTRIGMFIRRYCPTTRPWMPFHTDGNIYTANVALSSPSDHQGGNLLCLVGGAVSMYERELGTATVHKGDVCHAVTPVSEGVRYSLLMFFHDDDSLVANDIYHEKPNPEALVVPVPVLTQQGPRPPLPPSGSTQQGPRPPLPPSGSTHQGSRLPLPPSGSTHEGSGLSGMPNAPPLHFPPSKHPGIQEI